MNANTDRQDTIETIRRLIDAIHTAMLTTITSDGMLRSRPMITARHEFDGDLWFFTLVDDPKVDEIRSQPAVNVAYASPGHDRYVSLSGQAELITDRKRIETLWSDELLQWFPDGPGNQKLALLRIDVAEAEYWDHKAGRLGGFVKSLFSNEQQDTTEHRKIHWHETIRMT